METKTKNLSFKTKVYPKNESFIISNPKNLAFKLSIKISSLHAHLATLFYPEIDSNSLRLFLKTINNIRSSLKTFMKKSPQILRNMTENPPKTSNSPSKSTFLPKDMMAAKPENLYLSKKIQKPSFLRTKMTNENSWLEKQKHPEKPLPVNLLLKKPLPDKLLPEKHLLDNPLLREPLPDKLLPEKPLPGKPLSEKSLSMKPLPKKPLPEKPLPEKPLTGKPLQEEPLQEEPLPEKPLPEKSLPEKPLPEKPLPEKPLPEKPLPEKPLPEKPLPEKPLPEKPLQEKPLPERDRRQAEGLTGDRAAGNQIGGQVEGKVGESEKGQTVQKGGHSSSFSKGKPENKLEKSQPLTIKMPLNSDGCKARTLKEGKTEDQAVNKVGDQARGHQVGGQMGIEGHLQKIGEPERDKLGEKEFIQLKKPLKSEDFLKMVFGATKMTEKLPVVVPTEEKQKISRKARKKMKNVGKETSAKLD